MPTLKEKLFKIFEDGLGKHKKLHNIREYDMMIRFGSLGELTEDYFLFIYRDTYRSPAYYGAVLFLNKRDRSGRPVSITCFEETGEERERHIYIYAAIHFLKKNYSNLMKSNEKVEFLFNTAKKKIKHFMRGKSPAKICTIEDFKYSILNQRVEAIEQNIDFRNINHQTDNSDTEDFLERTIRPDKKEKTKTSEKKSKIGLALSINELGNYLNIRTMDFSPVIISNKNRIVQLSNQNIDRLKHDFHTEIDNKILSNFLELYIALHNNGLSSKVCSSIVNDLYFEKLCNLIFEDKYKNIFFKTSNIKNDSFVLKTEVFKKIEIKFAPLINKNNSFSVFLYFITESGLKISAKDSYIIRIFKESVYVYFTDQQNDHYFVKPDLDRNFIDLFKIIEKENKFQINSLNSLIIALNKIKTEYIEIKTELIKKYYFKFLPTPVLKIVKENGNNSNKQNYFGDKIIIEFDYLESIRPYLKKNPDKELFFYDKNSDFEKECFTILDNDNGLQKEISYDNYNQSIIPNYFFREDPMTWLIDQGEKYIKKGFRIYSEEQKQYIGNINSKFNINTRSTIDWLEFLPEINDSISGKKLLIDSIVDEKKGLIADKRGKLHIITKEQIQKLKDVFIYGEKSGNYYKIPSANFVLINKLYDERTDDIPQIKDILTNNRRILDFDKIKEYTLSDNFKGELRTYQKAGFDWLNFLREYKFSGCLADDMGLGKTVQTIAFLQSLKDDGKLKTSVLLVPVSAIPNWENEIKKFSTTINYIRHIGTRRGKTNNNWNNFNLIITSYATLRNDIEIFKDFNFDYIILDESQNIKNHTSQVAKAVKLINGKHKLALSGTPIENNSIELWSLFDFLMPGYLGNIKWFKEKFERQNSNNYESDKSERFELLKKMIFPFMLRRKKEEVEKYLPPKTEIIVKLKMKEDQQNVYEETAKKYRDELELEKGLKSETKNNALKVLEGILRLRQICLFPKLADEKFKNIQSAKFEHFKEQLKEILAKGHKVLIFSQFTKVLSILKKSIKSENINYSYLDGSTTVNKRKEAIEQFQETEETSVFLLSLKAGGVAINLTKADYVIIFDPWWNPAVEAQAIDRSHRIGQKKNVFVYKMVLENSIEEKMLKLQERKRDLFENIITTDSTSFKDLSKEELLDLFK